MRCIASCRPGSMPLPSPAQSPGQSHDMEVDDCLSRPQDRSNERLLPTARQRCRYAVSECHPWQQQRPKRDGGGAHPGKSMQDLPCAHRDDLRAGRLGLVSQVQSLRERAQKQRGGKDGARPRAQSTVQPSSRRRMRRRRIPHRERAELRRRYRRLRASQWPHMLAWAAATPPCILGAAVHCQLRPRGLVMTSDVSSQWYLHLKRGGIDHPRDLRPSNSRRGPSCRVIDAHRIAALLLKLFSMPSHRPPRRASNLTRPSGRACLNSSRHERLMRTYGNPALRGPDASTGLKHLPCRMLI